jgi:hypothetical protein
VACDFVACDVFFVCVCELCVGGVRLKDVVKRLLMFGSSEQESVDCLSDSFTKRGVHWKHREGVNSIEDSEPK